MEKIPLNTKRGGTGEFAICSPIDYEELMKYNWHKDGGGYPKARINTKLVGMHTYVKLVLEELTLEKGQLIDHRPPGNRLDCRRENLRIFTALQNSGNRRKREDAISQYNGVSYDKKEGKYRVQVQINYKMCYVGKYYNEIEAAESYDRYLLSRPDFDQLGHNLNFPERKDELLLLGPPLMVKKKQGSKYKGIGKTKTGLFYATVLHNKITIRIGSSRNEEECAKLYDDYIVNNKLNKKLNFDREGHCAIKTQKIDIDNQTVQLVINNNPNCVVLIDREDYDRVKIYRTTYTKNDKGYEYIIVCVEKKLHRLHRYIMNMTNPAILIDHEDNNPLNCKKENLRLTDYEGNGQNHKKQKNASSRFYGVRKTRTGKYEVRVIYGGKTLFRKFFDLENEAALAYDDFITKNLSHTLKKTNSLKI